MVFSLLVFLSLFFWSYSQKEDVPSNTILYFQSNPEGSKGDLFVIRDDGTGKRQLGTSGIRPDHYPNWSKNGKHITFESYRKGGWRIWIMDENGQRARRLIQEGYGTHFYEFDPTFNASGDKVIYSRHGDLWEVEVLTGKFRKITHTDDAVESQPDVSVQGMLLLLKGKETFLRFVGWINNKKRSSHLPIIRPITLLLYGLLMGNKFCFIPMYKAVLSSF